MDQPQNIHRLGSVLRSRLRFVISRFAAPTFFLFQLNLYAALCNMHILFLIIVQIDATQSSLFIILQVHCTCFRCQLHPSSGAHKTVTTASGAGHIFCAATSLQRGQASLEGGSCSTEGCSYSFVYS